MDVKCTNCESYNINYVRFQMKNGVFILRKQCFDCGYLLTLNYKRKSVSNFDKLPLVDTDLREHNNKKYKEKAEIKKIFSDYSGKFFNRQWNYYRNTYLKSDEWRHKRKLIMNFYNWECNRCENKATDLHHKTYKNIFKEKFDDLEPLCRSCHEKEHNIEKKHHREVKPIIKPVLKDAIRRSGLSLISLKQKKTILFTPIERKQSSLSFKSIHEKKQKS